MIRFALFASSVRTVFDRRTSEVRLSKCSSKRKSAGSPSATEVVSGRSPSTQAIEATETCAVQTLGQEVQGFDLDGPPPVQSTQRTFGFMRVIEISPTTSSVAQ